MFAPIQSDTTGAFKTLTLMALEPALGLILGPLIFFQQPKGQFGAIGLVVLAGAAA